MQKKLKRRRDTRVVYKIFIFYFFDQKRYLRNLQISTLNNSSTLNRVPEVTHPAECHLRVMLNGDDAHEGAKSQNWEWAYIGSSNIQKKLKRRSLYKSSVQNI